MNRATPWLLLVCLLAMVGTVLSQQDNEQARQTLAGIKEFSVVVDIPENLARQGLDPTSIQTDLELSMRLAGIKVVNRADQAVSTGIPIVGLGLKAYSNDAGIYGFSIQIGVYQIVSLLRDQRIAPVFAMTWHVAAAGTCGEKRLSELRTGGIKDGINIFINAYLSVNPKGGTQ